MNDTLKLMLERGQLRGIDVQFACRMSEVFNAPFAQSFLAMLFYAVSSADTYADDPEIFPFYKEYKDEIDLAFSAENISRMKAVGIIAEAPDLGAPIISSNGRLYLKTFYLDECTVRDYILSSASEADEYPDDTLKELLDKFFGTEPDMQKAAALEACTHKFCVISGGPGTGKTTTVFNVLAMLCSIEKREHMIAAAAPTGKAAARLTESIAARTAKEADSDYIKYIPQKAVTLHRLIRMRGDSGRAMFNSQNPMPYDIVVVDEASMVDIGMMAALVRAMKPTARLIMLGDKDQLASVQPGNVLGDICRMSGTDVFSESAADKIHRLAGIKVETNDKAGNLSDITIRLNKSRRFDSEGGIGLLAEACRTGRADDAIDLISNDTSGRIRLVNPENMNDELSRYFTGYYDKISSCATPDEAIKAVGASRILTPHSKGISGAERINREAIAYLSGRGLIDGTKRYFHGLPVIISENDYSTGLFNGDTGVIFNSDGLRAYFENEDGVRAVSVLRMPSWSPAFAMTVHKSQGSEFDNVVLILPDADSNVMTRELFYTAATRTRQNLTIIAKKQIISACINRTILRKSGLFI